MLSTSKPVWRSFTFCVFPHPWLHSGVLTARIAVIVSTFLWGLMVLLIPEAWMLLEYQHLSVAPEDFWGIVAVMIATVQLWRTYTHDDPSFLGMVLNAMMVYLWTYIVLSKGMAHIYTPISGFASCVTIMLFSWWNLISLPKRDTWHGSKSPFVG